MAEKKAVKKATKTAKKATKSLKKSAKGVKEVKKGDAFKCSVCGLVVSVDETCGCIDTCDLVCCETPMKSKRA